MAETRTPVRAGNQSGNIGNHETLTVFEIHDPKVRCESRERVFPNLGPRRTHRTNESGLTRIGEPNEPDFGERTQLQTKAVLRTWPPLFEPARRLVGRRRKMRVASSSLTARGHQELVALMAQIAQELSGRIVEHDRSQRDR